MSFLTSDLPTTLLLIAIGVIIGAALTKILNRGPKPAELQQKLDDTQDQFNSYQKEVDKHFQKTAELVNNLTNSYQEVHQHLSSGAQNLAQHTPETLESSQFKALSDDNTAKSASEESQNDHDDPSKENETKAAQDPTDTPASNSHEEKSDTNSEKPA
jgi:uncharacterized membrane-anchored protein YhcB (DUF1043 family)